MYVSDGESGNCHLLEDGPTVGRARKVKSFASSDLQDG